jgi:hypothetical protein
MNGHKETRAESLFRVLQLTNQLSKGFMAVADSVFAFHKVQQQPHASNGD